MGLVLVFAGIVIAAVAVAVFASRWLLRRGRVGRVILGLMSAALGLMSAALVWFVYEALYPPESFYLSEFERLTRISLPKQSQFVEKTATFPDHFGDYSACFIVRLSPEDIAALTAVLGVPKELRSEALRCSTQAPTSNSQTKTALYDLASRATRTDAQIYIAVSQSQNLAQVSWYLW